MDPITALADELAIRNLSHRYALALDRGDLEEWRSLFSASAVVESGSAEPRGLDDIMRIPVDQLQRYEKTLHSVTTQVIQLAGDTATGVVYCTAHHFYRDFHQGGRLPFDLSHDFIIRYEDEYVREGGAWVFARRRIDTLARSVQQVIVQQVIPAG